MSDATLIADLVRAGLDPELLQRVALELARGQAAIAAAERTESERIAKIEAAAAAKREANADRQRRFRERGNACNALRTVTERDEALPPQRSPGPPKTTPQDSTPSDPKGSSAPKGARQPSKSRNRALPTDWQPGERSERVRQELGRSTEWMRTTATEMRVWAESKGEIRSDWDATHDGWMRREAKREGASPPPGRPPPRGSPPERRSSHGPLSLLASLNGANHDPSGSFHDDRTVDHDPADGRPDRPLHEPDGGSSGRAGPENRVRYLRAG